MGTKGTDDGGSKRGATPIGPARCILVATWKFGSDEDTPYRVWPSIRIHRCITVAAKGGNPCIIRRHTGSVGKGRGGKTAIDGGDTERRLITGRGTRRAGRLSILIGTQRVIARRRHYQCSMSVEALKQQAQSLFDMREDTYCSGQLSSRPSAIIEPQIGKAPDIRHDGQAEVDDKAAN